MWENKKVFKRISLLLVLTIFIGFGLPINEIAIAVEINQYEKSAKENHIKQKEKNKAKTEIGKFEEDLNKHYEKVKESTKKEDLKSLKENIKGLKEALKIKKTEVIEELNKNEQTMKKLKIPSAQKRHEEFKKEIDKKLLDFEELLKEVDNLSNTLKEAKGKDYEELKEKIKEIETIVTPEQSEDPIGSSLPHKNVQADSAEPRVNKGITPLYMNNNIQSNSSEDLEETIETKANEEIKNLADSLETPLEIYEYMLNNITFEPYYGSRKGSIGTFEQGSGNDIDQASLLISMLRHNKIPARYVKGTVEITAEEAMGWTGAETPQAAANILATSGRPVTGITSGGKITAVRLEKVWVEAYIPYENYRGIGKNEGQKIWVPLDPSFKQYEEAKEIDIENIFKENISSIIKEETETVTDEELQAKIDELKEQLGRSLDKQLEGNNDENLTINDILGKHSIKPQSLGLISQTLPYKTITVLEEFSKLPEKYSDTVSFSIRDNDPYNIDVETTSFKFKERAASLYGKKITLSWAPATEEDKEIINHYGNIFKTPAYLVKVKPQLKIDGEVVSEGQATRLGTDQEFTMNISSTGIPQENINNTLTAGGMYSIGLDYGIIPVEEMNRISERMDKVKGNMNVDNIYTDEGLGELLNTVVKGYFAQLDSYNSIISDMNKVKSTRLLSAGMTGYDPKVSYMFNSPTEIREGSLYIDIDRDIHSVVSLEGDKEKEVEYMLTTGVIASSMEHEVFEQITDTPSVSAIKVLEESNKREIPIYNITKDNISEILPKLEVSESVKRNVTNAVREGKTVSIPERNIEYGEWIGTGYIVLDTETGSAGYMISGGLAGGSTSATEIFERLVSYLEGAKDSFIGSCMWLVEVLVNRNFTQRLIEEKDDFVSGLEEGMKEPLGFSEESGYTNDKSIYLLGKMIGNQLTVPYLIKLAGSKVADAIPDNGGVLAVGSIMTLPAEGLLIAAGKGLAIAGGVVLIAVGISANYHFINNALEFASSLEDDKEDASKDEDGSRPAPSGDTVTSNKGNTYDNKPSDNHSTTTENPITGEPNSSVDILDKNGNVVRRRWYDSDGNQIRDLDYTNHGNPKRHPEWPHEHGPRIK